MGFCGPALGGFRGACFFPLGAGLGVILPLGAVRWLVGGRLQPHLTRRDRESHPVVVVVSLTLSARTRAM